MQKAQGGGHANSERRPSRRSVSKARSQGFAGETAARQSWPGVQRGAALLAVRGIVDSLRKAAHVYATLRGRALDVSMMPDEGEVVLLLSPAAGRRELDRLAVPLLRQAGPRPPGRGRWKAAIERYGVIRGATLDDVLVLPISSRWPPERQRSPMSAQAAAVSSIDGQWLI